MASARNFGVSVEALDERTSLVEVTGDIDEATSYEFEQRLFESIDDAHTDAVVVDLSGVTFVGSAALTALVRSFEQPSRHGDLRVAIVANDSRVTTIFEVSRLSRVFPLCASRAAAIALVQPPA